VDKVPGSPLNALRYISAAHLPAAFVEGTMDGPFVGPHSADLVRGALLVEHGDVFLDVGTVLTRSMDRICWNQLEDPNTPYSVAAPYLLAQAIANHMVAARQGDPFITRW
jgi:hypothetical protein